MGRPWRQQRHRPSGGLTVSGRFAANAIPGSSGDRHRRSINALCSHPLYLS